MKVNDPRIADVEAAWDLALIEKELRDRAAMYAAAAPTEAVAALRRHVTGAIAEGKAEAIVEQIAAREPEIRESISVAWRKPKKEKPKSRATRWSEACAAAREAFDKMSSAKDEFESAMSDLDEIRQEFESWHDNLEGKFEGSALVSKLEAVKDLTTEVEIDLSEAESALDEAEGADLPLGFGRD